MTDSVVVTGLGILCSLGRHEATVWKRACEGRTSHLSVKPWMRPGSPPVGLVPAFDPRRYLDRRRRRFVTRDVVLGMAAAGRALEAAGFGSGPLPDRTACLVAAPLNLGEDADMGDSLRLAVDRRGRFDIERFAREGVCRINPLSLIRALSNGLLCQLTIQYGLRGFNTNISAGGTSSILALASAVRGILMDRFDRALVVGYDGLNSALCLCPRGTGTRASPSAPRPILAPFVADSPRLCPAEGAAAVVLERRSLARRRDARVWAEVVGSGHARIRDCANPVASAARTAVENALAGSGDGGDALDFVHVDGWGGRRQWKGYGRALARIPGKPPCMSSTQPVTGWAPAASGLLGLVFAIFAQRSGIVPPTSGHANAHPRLAVEIPRMPIRRRVRAAAILTSDPTGEYAVLVVRRPPREGRTH